MSRRGSNKRRKTQPDQIYNDLMVAKLINRSMKDGKKSVSEKQVYTALELIGEKSQDEPLKVFHKALNNIKPVMEVRPRRIGGAAYQVPMPVRGSRQDSLGIRWMIEAARSRSNSEFHTYAEKLATEILEAAEGEGLAIKKKTEVERMAEANRAFAHFRW